MHIMSILRKGRKIKLTNPEEQPQISQFTVDIGQSPTTRHSQLGEATTPTSNPITELKGKKRRRSTGEKAQATKKRNLPSDPTLATNSTMADPRLDSNSATNAMLCEIKKMEERLSEKITTSKDHEMTEMEERLNNNIRSTIDTSIKDALKVIQTSLNTAVENNVTVHSHTVELKGLRDENSRLNRKVQQLTAEQSRMKQQLTKIENRSLENSLIIRGLPEDFKETEQMIGEKIHGVLSKIMQGETEDMKLANAKQLIIKSSRRLGRPNRQRTRPVSVELLHKQDVDFILENKFDLERGIYVDREYPLEVERKRKTLLPILRAAKRSGEYKKQSKLEDDKIVLKGRKYGVNTLNQLPEELNVFKVTTKENADTIGYFGEINPLSNFYPAPFIYDGVQYLSSEQFIQASKAKYFGDADTYNQIMGCSTSLECKRASRLIRNVDIARWENVAGNICQPGIRAKFLQNPSVMDTLIRKTGLKTIVECASDRLWGTGIPLNDPTCLDPQKWFNQGIMGQILEGIRNETLQIQHQQQEHYSIVGSTGPSSSHTNNGKLLCMQSHMAAPMTTNAMAPTYNAAVTEPVPSQGQSSHPSSNSVQTCLADEYGNGSASTTPVSDTTETTSSDAEPGELNQCISERQSLAMEESVTLPPHNNKPITASINPS